MTREEEINRKLENIHLRGRRALETAKVFIEYNGKLSDIELASVLEKRGIKTSSSTVGRDLTFNLEKYFRYVNRDKKEFDEDFLIDNQIEMLDFIKRRREENALEGRIKGGNNYAKNNTPIRDENSHFKGSMCNV